MLLTRIGLALLVILLILIALLAALAMATQIRAGAITAQTPNIGELTDVGGYSLNALHVPAGPEADLPAIVFIHGASGNLRDQAGAFLERLRGRAEQPREHLGIAGRRRAPHLAPHHLRG